MKVAFASLDGTFHLSLQVKLRAIALITIHYLGTTEQEKYTVCSVTNNSGSKIKHVGRYNSKEGNNLII